MADMTYTRRELIGAGAGLAIAGAMTARAQTPAVKPKAKAVIQIWLWGGPSHTDSFDPKPDAGQEYTGQLNSPIATKVAGMRINELLPELAKQADKYSLIRSMTHGNNGHETAAYMVQTGHPSGDGPVFPGVGAVVSLFKGYDAGYKGLIPPYVVLTQLQGRFSEAGFLGSKAKPFATGGDPNAARFVVEGVTTEGLTEARLRDRRDLMHRLNSLEHALKSDPALVALGQAEEQAYDLILGDAGKVFDLSLEKDDLRARYGRTTFGQSCLMARRLVERGVPYVTINNPGWDTHKEHFQSMRQKLPQLDRGVSSLLQDLADHGLLDSTIVWVGGEFGRTPKVAWEAPWNGGRHHWGQVFSALVAGGGFKGGQVIGDSGPRGEEVKERPVHPADLIVTMYGLLGIDPNATLPHPQGLQLKVAPPKPDGLKTNGPLTELV